MQIDGKITVILFLFVTCLRDTLEWTLIKVPLESARGPKHLYLMSRSNMLLRTPMYLLSLSMQYFFMPIEKTL